MSSEDNIYDQMIAAGVPVSCDGCNDMMVPVTPETTAMLEAWVGWDKGHSCKKEKAANGKDSLYRVYMAWAPFWRNVKKFDFGT